MEKQDDKKEIIKKQDKGSFVTIPDIMDMKVLRMQGYSIQKIVDKIGRGRKTVENSLKLFEQLLPDVGDLKDKLLNRLDEVQEQLMQNAEKIIKSSDLQVMRKIYDEETTAMDAAKVSQIYASRLTAMTDGKLKGGETDRSIKVINFINQITIKTEKDDRHPSAPRPEKAPVGDGSGGKAPIIEGVVQD